MQQFWLVERTLEDGVRNLYFCNSDGGREGAKRLAGSFLLGNADEYIVTPLTNPGEIVKLKINIGMTTYV